LQFVKCRRRRAIQQWVTVVEMWRDDAAPNRYGELCGQHVPYVPQSFIKYQEFSTWNVLIMSDNPSEIGSINFHNLL